MSKVSISQAWDETRAILARDGKLISTVALALVVLPGVVLNVLMPRGANLPQSQQLVWVMILLMLLIVSFIGQLSIVRLSMGPHISVGEAIRHGAARVLPFLGAFLIWIVPLLVLAAIPYGLLRSNPTPAPAPTPAGLGLLAITVLGLFLGVRLMLVGPVATAEPGGSFAILHRSWTISAGNWWRLFGFLLMFAIGAIALLWAVSASLGVVARLLVGTISPLSVPGLILILIAQVLTAAIYVVLFVMQTRIYLQLAGKERASQS